jgi:hypothetical protein
MRQICVTRIDTNRDPGIPGAVWYGGIGSFNEPTPAPPTIDAYYEALPEPPQQHNDHVMTYWTWRLDRLEARRNG